jgi:hypothetical protein
MREPRTFRLTTIINFPPNDDGQTNEPFRGVRRPKGQREARGRKKMTKDEMIGWFKSAPKGSRHERMLWAARKIAHLTGATEGGAYTTLLDILIEAERLPRRPILGFSMTADD